MPDSVGMVRLGPVPTVTVPPTVMPAPATTSSATPTTTAAAAATTTVPAPRSTTAPPEAVPVASPDTPFTVATATGALLEAFRTVDGEEAWWTFPNLGPFDGARILLVAGDHGDHLEVALPVRPNGTVGFVRRQDVVLSTHRARVIVDLSGRRVTAWEDGELVADGAIALGAEGTPSPAGEFYINEIQRQDDPDTLFGEWILGTLGFSETLGLVFGGDPAVALHGTNDPSVLGTAVSLGCIRMHNDVVE